MPKRRNSSKTNKDACYRKVKASVKAKGGAWPSAYASGRIVKCRQKKGGGNAKTKKGKNLRSSIKMVKASQKGNRKKK
jgi:hypothetical protein